MHGVAEMCGKTEPAQTDARTRSKEIVKNAYVQMVPDIAIEDEGRKKKGTRNREMKRGTETNINDED